MDKGFFIGDSFVFISRSKRAKHLTLRIKGDRSGFTVTVPEKCNLAKAEEFVQRNQGWISANKKHLIQKEKFFDGAEFSFIGEQVKLVHLPTAKRGVWKEKGIIYVSGEAEYLHRRTNDFLKKEFLSYLKSAVSKYNTSKEKKIQRISIRNNTSRWGSCSSNNTLSFNFYLCYAPESIIDYVVVHELSHLSEMNHSLAFWQEVKKLYPDYKRARNWLKRNGQSLYKFSA